MPLDSLNDNDIAKIMVSQAKDGSRAYDRMPSEEKEDHRNDYEADEEDDEIEGSWLQELEPDGEENEVGDELSEMEIPQFIDIIAATSVAGANDSSESERLTLRENLRIFNDDADTAVSSVTGTRHTRSLLVDDDIVEDTRDRYRRQIATRMYQDESLHRRYRLSVNSSNSNHSISISSFRSSLIGSPSTPTMIKSLTKPSMQPTREKPSKTTSTNQTSADVGNRNSTSTRNSTRNYIAVNSQNSRTFSSTELVEETKDDLERDVNAVHHRN